MKAPVATVMITAAAAANRTTRRLCARRWATWASNAGRRLAGTWSGVVDEIGSRRPGQESRQPAEASDTRGALVAVTQVRLEVATLLGLNAPRRYAASYAENWSVILDPHLLQHEAQRGQGVVQS